MENVSVIIPNRGGKDLDKVIKNFNDTYKNFKNEIIIVEQKDALPFMRGQLFNIGVKFAKYDNLILSDNDIWHLRELPFF